MIRRHRAVLRAIARLLSTVPHTLPSAQTAGCPVQWTVKQKKPCCRRENRAMPL